MRGTLFRAVLLDFGGTLFSYRPMDRPTLELLRQALDRLQIEAEMPEAIQAWRAANREAWRTYMHRPFYLHRDLFRESFDGFARELGAEASADFLDWFHEEQRRLVLDHMKLRPGCVETLRELGEAGLHVGIVSNIDEDYLEPMLSRAGLEPVVHSRTSSEEARSCKPDLRIFRYALEKAGVDAAEALFVGDSPEADVLGGCRAGMTTVLIEEDGLPPPGSGEGPAAEPDHVIRELPELLGIVRRPEA
jgi:putative hydrolase of the HAD superfamily